ncbi:hypothetical protein MNBD_ALPHA08-1049 [hydrothermal vent metagenome]|uniref:Uncharacterized protein n=1 Tax=hydrothermal vent metagenome TaxID=652676 RepID=A0A3B0RSN7_9ZZZZ
MLCRIFLGFFAIAVLSQVTWAQNFDAEIKKAVELSTAGKPAAALEAMDRATTALWLRSPLTVTKAVLVTKPAKVFGEYDKRPNNVFPAGGKVRVYTELIGYDWQKIDDLYKINVIADVSLKNTKGKILWSKKEFGVFRPAKPKQFKKLYVNLSLGIKGVPAGNYIVEYSLIDKIRKQVAVISLPFSIVGKPSQ